MKQHGDGWIQTKSSSRPSISMFVVAWIYAKVYVNCSFPHTQLIQFINFCTNISCLSGCNVPVKQFIKVNYYYYYYYHHHHHHHHHLWHCSPAPTMTSSFTKFRDHTQRTTIGRTPLDEWSARRRDLYLNNTQHTKQTNIHIPGGIRTHVRGKPAAVDLRLNPRGHWDRFIKVNLLLNIGSGRLTWRFGNLITEKFNFHLCFLKEWIKLGNILLARTDFRNYFTKMTSIHV
jgi:hypothetical protein